MFEEVPEEDLPSNFEEVPEDDLEQTGGFDTLKPQIDETGVPRLDVEGIQRNLGKGNLGGAIADVIAGGTYEAVRRPLDFFESIDPTGISRGGRPEGLPLGIPYEPQASKGLTDVAATVGPTILGGMGALKWGAALPGFFKWLAGQAGAALGYAAANDPEAGNLIIGQDSWIFNGLDEKDEEGRRNRLNTFLNDTADAMTLAFPAEAASQAVTKVGSLFWNTVGKPISSYVFGKTGEAIEEQVAAQFVHLSGMAREAKTPQERQLIIEDMAKFILDNQEIILKRGENDVAIARDTVSALEEGLRGSDIENASGIIERARQLRAGQQKGVELGSKLSEPSRQTEEMLLGEEFAKGGEEGINQAGAGVQKQAEQKFQETAIQPLEAAKAQRATESLGDKLAKLDINVSNEADLTKDAIRKEVRSRYDMMDKELQDLANDIPEGIEMDFSQDMDLISNLDKKYLKHFNIELGEDGLPEIVTGDFKTLYTKLIKNLSQDISRGLKGNKDVSDLIALRDIINSKVDELPEGVAFKDYFKNTWAPIWKDGQLEDFMNIYKETVKRGENVRPVDFETGTNKIIQGSLEGDPAFTKHLDKLLNIPDKNGMTKNSLITDWYLQNAAADLRSQLFTKTLDEVNTDAIISSLSKYGDNIAKVAPKEAERINLFLTNIRDQKFSIKQLDQQIDELTKASDKAEREIFSQDYKAFYDKGRKENPKLGTQYGNFDTLLNDKDAGSTLVEIMSKADDDMVKGIQAAYVRYLRDNILGSDRMIGGARKINTEFIKNALEGKSKVFDYGRTIFKDEPEAIEFFRSLMREDQRIADSLAKVSTQAGIQPGDIVRETSQGFDRLITLTFGVLNRMAARARSIKGMAMQKYSKDLQGKNFEKGDVLKLVIDKFYADPEYAVELLRKLNQTQGAATSPEFRQAFRNWIMFQLQGSDPAEIEKDINSVLPAGNLDDQTNQALEAGIKSTQPQEDNLENTQDTEE